MSASTAVLAGVGLLLAAAAMAGAAARSVPPIPSARWDALHQLALASGHASGRRRRGPSGAGGEPPERVLRLLLAADVPWEPAVVWRWWRRAVTAAVGAGALLAGPSAGILTALAAPVASWFLIGQRARAAHVRADQQLAPFLEETARELRAGSSLRTALIVVSEATPSPLAPLLRRLATAAQRGESLPAALDRWVAGRPTPATRLTGAALAMAAEQGGAPARSLDGVAASLRHLAAMRSEVHALGTQARASAAVLVLAPVGFTVLMAGVDGSIGAFLLRTPGGLACLLVGGGLDAVGAVWMHRITTKVAG